ncbi:JHBP domain containing protein [Asbolus verrucosus]|uniref:JHBP domain containing protein n=1 Tax=Asbolus verrucosus TaxID=1661398 RepID=A0A482W7J2_ASBVE|nr:JHBP domain containing protein [Asbolus verrucosus]
MQRDVVLLLFVVVIGADGIKLHCHAASVPASNFQKCNRKDPDFKECVLKAAQDGFLQLSKPHREVNLHTLDPLEVLELKIKAGTQTVAVDQNFKNCKLYGIDRTQLSRFEFDFEGRKIQAAGLIPEIRKLCEYEFDGTVLLLPIKGEGPSTIVLTNINATLVLPYQTEKKKNKTYFKFNSTQLAIEPELVSYNFENLFDGDKALGDNINKVLNENWKEVFDDVKNGYETALGLIIEQLFNRFFSKVSVEEALD